MIPRCLVSSNPPSKPGSTVRTTLRWCLLAAVAAVAAGCTPKPTIQAFTASATTVEGGEPVTLFWQVTDAETLTLTNGPSVSTTATQVVVRPTTTTTYTLVARNDAGEVSSAPITITVTGRLDATGGTYARAGGLGRTFAILLRDAGGQVPATDVQVTVTPPSGAPVTVTCRGGRALCLHEQPDVPPVAGEHTATATVGGAQLTHTFLVDPNNRLPPPGSVVATESSATSVAVAWAPAAGAVSYRVKLTDAGGASLAPEQIVTGTNVTLVSTSAVPDDAQVVVEASAVDLTGASAPEPLPIPNITAAQVVVGGAPEGWTLYSGANYTGDSLSVTLPSLTTSERVAVIVLNIGGADIAAGATTPNVQLTVTGTTSFPKQEEAPSPKPGSPDPLLTDSLRAHEQIQALNEAHVEALLAAGEPKLQQAAAVAPAVPATTSFCTRRGQTSTFTRRTATLRHESAHLAVYVDDADLADYSSREPGIWESLAADWEGTSGIYALVTGAFGPESDVDANQKLTVFFSDELGAPQSGGVLLGYFNAADTLFEKDTSAGCSGNRSNGADMFFMNGLSNLTAAGYSATEVISRIYPDTLAHEFQHLINANAHCLLADCTALEDIWLNEGLSMVAEDIAGFGWNVDRAAAELYLDRLDGPNNYGYHRRSVTVWEGDPIGNYQGVHSLVRYWADRYGEGVLRQLVAGNLTGTTRTEAVLLIPFAQQLAEWTTTLMFSNEPFNPSPLFNYTGANWTPFHQDVNYVNHVPLNPGSIAAGFVRKDGWNAFVTGNGTGGDATVTVTSSMAVKPHVVVVRFAGDLPQCKGLLSVVTGNCP